MKWYFHYFATIYMCPPTFTGKWLVNFKKNVFERNNGTYNSKSVSAFCIVSTVNYDAVTLKYTSI